MQPPSKSKIWANEGAAGSGANSIPVVESGEVPQKNDASEEDYEPVPKKRKRTPLTVSQPDTATLHETVLSVDGMAENQSPDIKLTNDLEDKELPMPPEPAMAVSSDVDWLRSRTSRLLDLVDDDNAIILNSTTTVNNDRDGIAFDTKLHEAKRRTSDASSQTDEIRLDDTAETDSPQEDHSKDRIEESLPTGRLFVRNLSYSTSEDDLKAHFGRCGALAEVSISLSILRNLTWIL